MIRNYCNIFGLMEVSTPKTEENLCIMRFAFLEWIPPITPNIPNVNHIIPQLLGLDIFVYGKDI